MCLFNAPPDLTLGNSEFFSTQSIHVFKAAINLLFIMNQLIFSLENHCVQCEVRTESFYVIHINFMPQRLTRSYI
jgi:hypothetical protein